MRLRAVLYIATTMALALPASASAGGFATVGLESLPGDLSPGTPWEAKFTVLAHGRTPFTGAHPKVLVTLPNGDERGFFPARPSGEPGVYRADVVFPRAGRFRYVIDDGFTGQRHTFPAVDVGAPSAGGAPRPRAATLAPAPTSDDGSPLPLALGLGALAGLAGGGLVALARRRFARTALGA